MVEYDPVGLARTLADAMQSEHPFAITGEDASFIRSVWDNEYPTFPIPENVVVQYEEMKTKPFFIPLCANVWHQIDEIANGLSEPMYCNKYVATAVMALRNPVMQAEVLQYISSFPRKKRRYE